MQVNVLFFASLAEKIGTSQWKVSLPVGASLDDLKKIWAETYPDHTDMLAICLVAVNQEYVQGNPVLNHADEIAFFPPVSGG